MAKAKTEAVVPAEEGFLAHITPKLTCRFYEEVFPGIDEVVVAQVQSIAEMGAYVTLLEYNNVEGMILMSELSRRRIRSVNKLVRIGRDEFVMVLRADTEKGYIDLSKRRTTPEDQAAANNRYEKAKTIHSIIKHSATQLNITTNEELESLMFRSVWYLNKKHKKENEKQKASYEIFRRAVEDGSVLDECDLTDKEKEVILRNINLKLKPTPDKIRATISVSCTGPEGVDAVKEALREGTRVGNKFLLDKCGGQKQIDDDNQVVLNELQIQLIAPPEYVVTIQSLDKEQAIEACSNALEAIQNKIKSFSYGNYMVKDEPRVVGKEEDKQLQTAYSEAEAANRQVDGDGDDE